jgi:hypothetical protein
MKRRMFLATCHAPTARLIAVAARRFATVSDSSLSAFAVRCGISGPEVSRHDSVRVRWSSVERRAMSVLVARTKSLTGYDPRRKRAVRNGWLLFLARLDRLLYDWRFRRRQA